MRCKSYSLSDTTLKDEFLEGIAAEANVQTKVEAIFSDGTKCKNVIIVRIHRVLHVVPWLLVGCAVRFV